MGVKEEAVLIQEMQYVVENLIYHITEIMVSYVKYIYGRGCQTGVTCSLSDC